MVHVLYLNKAALNYYEPNLNLFHNPIVIKMPSTEQMLITFALK